MNLNHTIYAYHNTYRAVCVEFAKVDGVHKGDVVRGVPVETEGGRVRLFRWTGVMPLRAKIIHSSLTNSSPLEKLATCSSACQRAPCQSICWSAPPPLRNLSEFFNFLLMDHMRHQRTLFAKYLKFVCSLFYLTSSPFCPAGQLMMARLPLMKSFWTSTMMNADCGRTIWGGVVNLLTKVHVKPVKNNITSWSYWV